METPSGEPWWAKTLVQMGALGVLLAGMFLVHDLLSKYDAKRTELVKELLIIIQQSWKK